MWLIHHVSKNLILNQGCSQKCNNNENIHVDKNECPSQGDLLKFQPFFSSILVIEWFTILSNIIVCLFVSSYSQGVEYWIKSDP